MTSCQTIIELELGLKYDDTVKWEVANVSTTCSFLFNGLKTKYKRIKIDLLNQFDSFSSINYIRHNKQYVRIQRKLNPLVTELDKGHLRKYLFESIFDSVKLLFDEDGSDSTALTNLFDAIAKNNYATSFDYLPAQRSPNRKNLIQIRCELEKDKSSFYYLLTNSRQEIISKGLVFETTNNYLVFRLLFFVGKWVSETQFVLTDKNGEIFFRYNLIDDSINIEFSPIKHSMNQLNDAVIGLHYSNYSKLGKLAFNFILGDR